MKTKERWVWRVGTPSINDWEVASDWQSTTDADTCNFFLRSGDEPLRLYKQGRRIYIEGAPMEDGDVTGEYSSCTHTALVEYYVENWIGGISDRAPLPIGHICGFATAEARQFVFGG